MTFIECFFTVFGAASLVFGAGAVVCAVCEAGLRKCRMQSVKFKIKEGDFKW